MLLAQESASQNIPEAHDSKTENQHAAETTTITGACVKSVGAQHPKGGTPFGPSRKQAWAPCPTLALQTGPPTARHRLHFTAHMAGLGAHTRS